MVEPITGWTKKVKSWLFYLYGISYSKYVRNQVK